MYSTEERNLTHLKHRQEKERLMVKEGLELVQRRKEERVRQKQMDQIEVRKLIANYDPWGKPGGGAPNAEDVRRRKTSIHYYHLLDKKEGWTGEPAFRRLQHEHYMREQQFRNNRPSNNFQPLLPPTEMEKKREIHAPEEMITGGVELVPLLARRRGMPQHCPLSTTDVTNSKHRTPPVQQPARSPSWNKPEMEKEYLAELTNQVHHKQRKMRDDQTADILNSRRHFETWGNFWGRPGHGAPKERNAKENLNYLLYDAPVK